MKAEPTKEQILDHIRAERRKRAQAGMRTKVEKGFLVAQPKLGYKTTRTAEGTIAVLDPDTAPLVAQAFIEVALNGRSLRQAAMVMSKLGLNGRRGDPITISTLQRVLTDPAYAGLRAGWPAIVSKTSLETVRRILKSRRK